MSKCHIVGNLMHWLISVLKCSFVVQQSCCLTVYIIVPAEKTDISMCLSLLFWKLKLCIFLSFIVLCLLQPTANYDLAIIEDYLAGNAKIKISIKKQNGVVVIFGEPWQLLLTGSAVPRISVKSLQSV